MLQRARRLLLDSPEWMWLVFSLTLRAAFVLRLGGAYYQTDEHGYADLALRLAHLGASRDGGAADGPLVPGFLFALGFKLFGASLLGPRILQAFVGTFVAAAIGRATEALLCSREAGRLALTVSCIYPFFVYYSGMLLSETSYLALIVPALALLGVGLRSGSWPASAGGGLLLGLSALSRAEAAPVGALVLASMAAAAQTFDARGLRRWAVVASCWALPILASGMQNRIQRGAFALDTHGGITLLHGTMLFEPNEVDTAEAMRVFNSSALAARVQELPAVERDRALMRAGFSWMAAHPMLTLRQWSAKFVSFWRFYPRPDKVYEQDGKIANPSVGASRLALILISLLFEPALILGGFAGLWALRGRRELWPQWAFLVGTMGVHVFSVSQMRYRLPVMPALILGAASLAARATGPSAFQSEKR